MTTSSPSETLPVNKPSFAELLDDLFERRRRPDGSRYQYDDIVVAMSGETSAQHISQLRTGRIKNPGWNIIEGLCLFFDVSPEYFFPRLQGRPHKTLPPRPDSLVE